MRKQKCLVSDWTIKEHFAGTKELKRRRFVCSNEGHHLQKYFEATEQKREPRALTRCGCKAMLAIMRVAVTDPWFVNKFVDHHKHPLANPEEVVFLRSHRRITDAKRAEAIEYGIGGLRTCKDGLMQAKSAFVIVKGGPCKPSLHLCQREMPIRMCGQQRWVDTEICGTRLVLHYSKLQRAQSILSITNHS
jgi:hypothetical protein